MCRLHHEGCALAKRGCEVRQDIYEKVGFKVRKTLLNTGGENLGCDFVVYNENQCAEFTTRGRGHKIQVAKNLGCNFMMGQ